MEVFVEHTVQRSGERNSGSLSLMNLHWQYPLIEGYVNRVFLQIITRLFG